MLSNCRALDLTDEKGFLCGKILGDLGVDVIKIEKPGGNIARNRGPFWHDIADPEKSLYWFAYNSNKRGVTLNIEAPDGQDILKALAKDADFILESYEPGYLDSIGLGYSVLSKINPKIIMVSITPFGQTGPYKDYKAPDIVAMAMSGILYQTGEPGREPVNISLPQACLHAGSDAAVGALIAYYHREAVGEGQQVDVSMQQSTSYFLANAVPFWELNKVLLRRSGHLRKGMSAAAAQRQVWRCKDGFVFFVLIGGKTGGKVYRQLVKWMDTEGMSNEYVQNLDWESLDMATVTQNTIDLITIPIERFFLAHTKKELLDGAVERNVSLCPLSTISDLLNDAQLRSRNFWVEIEHPELSTTMTYPREFVKSSEKVCATRFRAPLIGEHNEEIYKEIGISTEQLIILKEAGII